MGVFGLEVRRHTFQFRGRSFPNVAGVIPGSDPFAPRVRVGFNIEERKGWTYRVGSRNWAAQTCREGVRYRGALIL